MLYLIASLEELKSANPAIAREKETIRYKVMQQPEADWSSLG
jgi:hypothetical protein